MEKPHICLPPPAFSWNQRPKDRRVRTSVVLELDPPLQHLQVAEMEHEKAYRGPTLCLIDAVISIGVRYKQAMNAVRRFGPLPSPSEQNMTSGLLLDGRDFLCHRHESDAGITPLG